MEILHSKSEIRNPCAVVLITAILGLLAPLVNAVELHNWRAPYHLIASEMGLSASSPSTFFWDHLPAAPLFDSALWVSAEKERSNHWLFEPVAGLELETPAFTGGRYWSGYAGFLNNIRYRNLLVRQTLSVDKRYEDDPLYPAHPDRFARGRIEEAYLQLDWQYGMVRFGRMLRNWGPFADRSLLLSPNPYSYDALEWQVHSSLFEFRHLFAAFNQSPRPFVPDNLTGRYFSAHALTLTLGRWVNVGVLESMVFRRDRGFPDFQYLNPFSLYTVQNTNQEGNGNLMLGFQWNVRPVVEKLSVRGQVALDDIQVDSDLPTDNEPNHWGIDVGAYWRDLLPLPLRNLVKAGYRRASEWLYTVPDNNSDAGEGYTFLGRSLGLPENDDDRLWAGVTVVGPNYWTGSAQFGYARKGEKTVLSRWRDSEEGNTPGLPFDYLDASFPSGTVERAAFFTLEALGYYKDLADLRIVIDNRFILNKGHVPGGSWAYDPRIAARLSVHFSGLHWTLPR
ncbi:MAG: hypothetical protein JXA71_18355 [Chitinispirillaceae bacterium]|nr:hypothetical protein [Chitinispirillaceae bacterium]